MIQAQPTVGPCTPKNRRISCNTALPLWAHLGDVVALDVAHAVQRHKARKGHGQVVAQAQDLAALRRKHRASPVLTFQASTGRWDEQGTVQATMPTWSARS